MTIIGKKRVSGERVFNLAALAALIFLFVFFVGIVLSMAWYTDLEAFVSVLLSEEILFAIQFSILTATVATVICVIVAIPAAYTISRRQFHGKDVVDTLLDLPIVMPPIALGAALLIFFNTPVGLAIENSLMKFTFQQSGIVLAQFTVISALAVRFMKATFDSINPKYESVARTLGYSKLQAFFKVTLPLAKKGLWAAIILAWARALGEFGASVTLAGATRMKTETLSIAIFLSLATADVEKTIAVTFTLICIGLVVLIFIRKIGGRGYAVR